MKVIDLLNKIANGEEVPKHIKLKSGIELYYCEDTLNYYNELGCNELFGSWIAYNLNEEIKIIEEDKKIKHIENYVDFVNLKDSEKFDYLYEMETRIINYINKGDK